MPSRGAMHLMLALLLLASGCTGMHVAGPVRPSQPMGPAVARARLPALGFFEPKPGERKAAVVRILEVEFARLMTALELNLAQPSLPARLRATAPSAEEIAEEMEARSPMLKWATSRWLIDFLGIEKYGVWCPTLKRMEMHPWQWTPKGHPTLSAPTFIESLLALRPQLTSEIKRGFRTSPLRVCRLAYRAAIVYALAALSSLPGPQRKLIQKTWPRLVEHLATTLELNHKRVMRREPNKDLPPVVQWGQLQADRLQVRWEEWRGVRMKFA